MAESETVCGLLAELHAHRVRTMDPAALEVNINQRRTLVEAADLAGFVKPGDRLAPFTLPRAAAAPLCWMTCCAMARWCCCSFVSRAVRPAISRCPIISDSYIRNYANSAQR